MLNRHALLIPLLAAAVVAPPKGLPQSGPLANATPAQVTSKLGKPAVASEEGAGAMWTYRFEACALMVFFKDEGRGLRVSGLSVAARRRGEAPPSVERCVDDAKEG